METILPGEQHEFLRGNHGTTQPGFGGRGRPAAAERSGVGRVKRERGYLEALSSGGAHEGPLPATGCREGEELDPADTIRPPPPTTFRRRFVFPATSSFTFITRYEGAHRTRSESPPSGPRRRVPRCRQGLHT